MKGDGTLDETPETNFDAALQAGIMLAAAWESGAPYAVVPPGYQVEDLESFQDKPRRVSGSRVFEELESFQHYYGRFATGESSVFIDRDSKRIVAILDHSGPDHPEWHGHQCHLHLKLSDEWKTWMGSNQKRMTQVPFARFLEDNLQDIQLPEGAEVLEAARSLEATKKTIFKSDQHDHGAGDVVFHFETETQQVGELTLPDEFQLLIPVFRGSARYELNARLRYDIDSAGHLALWYDLLRPGKIEDAAVDLIVEEVRGFADHVYLGQ